MKQGTTGFCRFAGALLLAGLLAARPAGASSEETHRLVAVLAFAGERAWLDGPAAAIPPAELDAFRQRLYELGRTLPDAQLRERFVRRYPTPADFDAWALKELLAFSGAAKVVGIDVPPQASSIEDLVSGGARDPDRDGRNRDRVAYRMVDGQRQVLTDRLGRPVPFDPALLNLGRLGSVSSQAHAHFALASVEASRDPEVLKSDPRRFAVPTGFPPGPVLALAGEMAQLHTDLALLATLSDLQHGSELGWLFGAQGWHYIQDAGSQMRTIPSGIHEFYLTAQLKYWARAARSFGGLVGKLTPFESIRREILQNHLAIGEALAGKRLAAVAEGKEGPVELKYGLVTLGEDDEDLSGALRKRRLGPEGPFALELTRELVEASSQEGAEVYRLVRELVEGRYSEDDVAFDAATEDPDVALRPKADQSDEAQRFYGLQARSMHRVATALRLWRGLFLQAVQRGRSDPSFTQAVASRLMRQQLDLLDAAEARRAAYLKDLPPPLEGAVRDYSFIAAGCAIALGALLFLLGLRRRRLRPPPEPA